MTWLERWWKVARRRPDLAPGVPWLVYAACGRYSGFDWDRVRAQVYALVGGRR